MAIAEDRPLESILKVDKDKVEIFKDEEESENLSNEAENLFLQHPDRSVCMKVDSAKLCSF